MFCSHTSFSACDRTVCFGVEPSSRTYILMMVVYYTHSARMKTWHRVDPWLRQSRSGSATSVVHLNPEEGKNLWDAYFAQMREQVARVLTRVRPSTHQSLQTPRMSDHGPYWDEDTLNLKLEEYMLSGFFLSGLSRLGWNDVCCIFLQNWRWEGIMSAVSMDGKIMVLDFTMWWVHLNWLW